jgi:hypothetical protein
MGAASFSPYRCEISYVPLFVQKRKARTEVPGIINKIEKKSRSSERSSEHLSRRRTRFFSYLDPTGSKDFALLEYVMFS